MDIFSCSQFTLPLPQRHRFPMQKYRLLEDRVVEAGLCSRQDLQIPSALPDDVLGLAHRSEYVRRVANGELTVAEIRRMGFPWSKELVERSRRSSGATYEGALSALHRGCAANLAGGTHHAFADRGEGYCVFNDSAVAARALQKAGFVRRVVVLDCDVHQGNGTASIFASDDSVFTFSIHGARNFPYRKETSDLDIALADGTTDETYLKHLRPGIVEALDCSHPDLAVYLAGADPFHEDAFGRLAMTKAGLEERDRFVLGECKRRQIPVVVTMSGGYAKRVEDIVDIHFTTIRVATELFGKPQGACN